MFRAFNMGVGIILVCAPDHTDSAVSRLKAAGESAWVVGHVVARS